MASGDTTSDHSSENAAARLIEKGYVEKSPEEKGYAEKGYAEKSQAENHSRSLADKSDQFISRNGLEFAGTHLIVDLWGASRLDDLEFMQATMRESVQVAGAHLLHIQLHHFTPNGGITGVAVLAESHISVHTWPERGFAAFDIFMCGDAEPEKVIPILRDAFKPSSVNLSEHLRGVVTSAATSAVTGAASDVVDEE